MYASSYSKLVWGLVFVYIEFNIGSFDILPNFVGYIMVCLAVSALEAQHESFGIAKVPALIMVFVSLKDIIKIENANLLNKSVQSINIYHGFLGQLPALISLYLMYCICRGIYLAAQDRGLGELKESAKARWQFYFFITAAGLFIYPFLYNLPERWMGIMIIEAIIGLISVFSIIFLARKAKNQMAD